MRSVVSVVSVASLLVATLLGGVADARKPEDVFGGKILVSDQPFPTQARSPDAYIDAIKRNAKDRILEDRETKQWRVFFAAFFKQVPSDMEVNVRVYDVTNGAHRLVDTLEQYLSNGGIRAYVSDLKLRRGDGTSGYDPNTKIQLVMDSRGRVIAETTFYIVGEVKKGPTQIDFSQPDPK